MLKKSQFFVYYCTLVMVCLCGLLIEEVEAGRRFYMCVYGPDKYGDLREDVVDEETALMCDNCKCRLT